MAEIDMLVMVDRLADLDQVAKSLEAQGFQVHRKFSRFRTIVGSGESSLLNQLQSVDGVKSVRTSETYQLPPMDEKIPQ